MPRDRVRRWMLLGMAMLLGLPMGCLRFVHPVVQPPPEELQPCLDIPQVCKDRVYVFFLHGLDPFDLANLAGVRDYVNSLGFLKTYYSVPHHALYYIREIARVKQADPEARFVVIGFSYGGPLARDVVCSMRHYGIEVDLLVYLDGGRGAIRDLHKPSNAKRVLNVLAPDRDEERMIAGAANLRCDEVWHFGTPTHPATLSALSRGLTTVAAQVPIPVEIPKGEFMRTMCMPGDSEHEAAGWGFLKADLQTVSRQGGLPVREALDCEPSTVKHPD